jgi:hypothetical protein
LKSNNKIAYIDFFGQHAGEVKEADVAVKSILAEYLPVVLFG